MMNGNARDFFFHNRPLENNLDYLKKNDSHSEVNWEGESEFRNNSGIHLYFSQSKQSAFKQNTLKDDEPMSKSQTKNNPIKNSSQTKQIKSQMESFQLQQEDQDDINNNNKNNIYKVNSLQSPMIDKYPCEDSTNQASNLIDLNIVQQNDNKIECPPLNKQDFKNNEKADDSINNNSPHKNSKLISQQQIDLKGDYSPARSSRTNQIRSPPSDKSPQNSQYESDKNKPSNLKTGKENQVNQGTGQKGKVIEEKPKLFKFKTQLESVHEVECWKDYNRENSKDNKKLGCSCSIF